MASMTPWRIVFMGTPDFSAPALKRLLKGADPLVGVFTQPDKPAGRGLRERETPVKQIAAAHEIPLFQPRRLRHSDAVSDLKKLAPDLVVVVAYGQILSSEVLAVPKHGCVNIHASLLPRWRGAAPIQRAILAGDTETGITTMQMDEGLDTGPMLLRRSIAITSGMTGGVLHDRLAHLGADLIEETIAGLKHQTIVASQQPLSGVTYAKKLTREEGMLDWSRTAEELVRQISALDPWPTAYTHLGERQVKLFSARVGKASGIQSGSTSGSTPLPGEIIHISENDLEIACGRGCLHVAELQSAGKRRMDAVPWARGQRLTTGSRFL